jgi:hypothetical protein
LVVDIENGDIYVYERASRSFEVIDRQPAVGGFDRQLKPCHPDR